MRLAVHQHAVPAMIRAQPADDMFGLIEAIAETDQERARFEAALHGAELTD